MLQLAFSPPGQGHNSVISHTTDEIKICTCSVTPPVPPQHVGCARVSSFQLFLFFIPQHTHTGID